MTIRNKRYVFSTIVLLSGFFLAKLWLGFYYPDPYYLQEHSLLGKVIFSYLPLILFPALYGVIITLIIVKNEKIRQNIIILFFTVIGLFLILYPMLDIRHFIRYKKKSRVQTELYHPFLQLKPSLPEELKKSYAEQAIRIFCLGGSTTEFKDKYGLGWPERLEGDLRQIYNTDSIYVVNLGKQWYTTLHTLINYEINLRKYKPDIIIVMHNINDFLQNADFSYFSKGVFREDYGHFFGPSSRIFEQYGFFGKYWIDFRHMWNFKGREIIEQDSFPGLLSFERNIKTLIELASLDCTKVVLMSQPNILSETMDDKTKEVCNIISHEAVGNNKQWSYKTAYIGMKQYNDKIKEIAKNEKVYFIDLEKYVPKSLIYFWDQVHYNDTTFALISNTLSQEIFRLGVISNKSN